MIKLSVKALAIRMRAEMRARPVGVDALSSSWKLQRVLAVGFLFSWKILPSHVATRKHIVAETATFLGH